MDNVKLQVNLTEEDIYIFQKRVFYQNIPQVGINALSIIILVAAVISIINHINNGSSPIGSALLLIFPVIFLIIFPQVLKRTAKNAITTNKILQYPQNYDITDEGLSITSEIGNAFIKWSDFYKTMETKESFLFFLSKQQAYIIPKRYIHDDVETTSFIRKSISNVSVPPKEKPWIKKLFVFVIVYIVIFVVILLILLLYTSGTP